MGDMLKDGTLSLLTARHIWDVLVSGKIQVGSALDQDESIAAHRYLHEATEQADREVFEALRQAHLLSIDREEERGMISFASRRKPIKRIGLPEVRQFRQARCEAEEAEWRRELQPARGLLPEIRPLLMLSIIEVSKCSL